MDNDKELLEKAAKAAGMSVLTVPWPRAPDGWFYCEHGSDGGGMFYVKGQQARGGRWNPLQDDGDALRLAVKLRLSVKHGTDVFDELGIQSAFAYHGDVGECEFEPHGDDPYAATRRAVVRAAAAMAAGEEG